jgi:hypothetical protein
MKWNKIVGKSLIVAGSLLSILGITIVLVKGNSMVTIMSIPIVFLGIIIWHNAGENPSAKKGDSKSVNG